MYGAYKNVRNAAWQCLIDFEIKELPVNLMSISKKADIKILKNSSVNELEPGESGASLLEESHQWYIVYDDQNTRQRSRFTIAHEFGHIFLGHELRNGHHARTFDKSKSESEREADLFAARLLAPACVLWGLDKHTAVEISGLCDISISAAQARANRMTILYERNMFLTSPLERKVYDNFRDFITRYNNT